MKPANDDAVTFLPWDFDISMVETTEADGEKDSGSASAALPGRKLSTSKDPRMLKPFEIDLLRQDLKAALARLRAAP